jgi:hypothetical protein
VSSTFDSLLCTPSICCTFSISYPVPRVGSVDVLRIDGCNDLVCLVVLYRLKGTGQVKRYWLVL